jgi:hypothetical protein
MASGTLELASDFNERAPADGAGWARRLVTAIGLFVHTRFSWRLCPQDYVVGKLDSTRQASIH